MSESPTGHDPSTPSTRHAARPALSQTLREPLTLEALATRFSQATRQQDGSYKARCPAHDDTHPSLGIFLTVQGTPTVKCHAGCTWQAILAAVGVEPRQLYASAATMRQIVATYLYTDVAGTVLFRKHRTVPKSFWLERPDPTRPGAWVSKGVGPFFVLYNLPAVHQAMAAGTPVYVVEGEKDADTLTALGLVATCNPEGAAQDGQRQKWKPAYTATLAGAHLVLLPDNDAPGAALMQHVAQACAPTARSLTLVTLPDLPEHGDVSEWLAAGGTAEALAALVAQAPPWDPPALPDAAAPDGAAPAHAAPGASLPLSDTFNARALVAQHGANLRYCPPWKSWMVWTGTHWQRDEAGTVMERAKATVSGMLDTLKDMPSDTARDTLYKHIKASLNTSRLKALVENAQSHPGIPVLPDAFDQHHWLLNCANGTLDLTTGTLQPHTRVDMLTRCLSIPYDAEARCPAWEGFLWRIMGGSGEAPDDPDVSAQVHEARYQADERARRLIGFLQRAVGYSLTGSTREHCFFLLYGTGRNGKSTFIETVQAMLGPYGKTAEMSTFLARQTETVRNDLADLHGVRFVAGSETDKGKRLAESLVRRLTGGDRIKARFLFQEYFEFLPQMHVWLAVNDKPLIRGTDVAMWERVRLIPFEVFIPPEERDKHLGEKLRAELPGILAWAVTGCLEWQRYDGLKDPEDVRDATEAYRQEMDVFGRFLAECCTILPGVRVKAITLYKAYQEWCGDNGCIADSMTAIGYRLETMQFEKKKSNGWWYLGIGLEST